MNRHIFRGSKANRDRREAASARDVIGEAWRRHLAEQARRSAEYEAVAKGLENDERRAREACIWCGREPASEEHHPYCGVQCAVDAERGGE